MAREGHHYPPTPVATYPMSQVILLPETYSNSPKNPESHPFPHHMFQLTQCSIRSPLFLTTCSNTLKLPDACHNTLKTPEGHPCPYQLSQLILNSIGTPLLPILCSSSIKTKQGYLIPPVPTHPIPLRLTPTPYPLFQLHQGLKGSPPPPFPTHPIPLRPLVPPTSCSISTKA